MWPNFFNELKEELMIRERDKLLGKLIICSGCGGLIYNKYLRRDVMELREKISEFNYGFSVDVPVYCCNCFHRFQ